MSDTVVSIQPRLLSDVIRHEVQPEESTAKAWVKKPGGAICRKDSNAVSPSPSPPP